MRVCRPLAGSQQAPDYRQLWHMEGVWRRAINFYAENGEILTLHRQGNGISPGGWVLRGDDFHHLSVALHDGHRPITRSEGIQVGSFLLCPPVRYVSLSVKRELHRSFLDMDILVYQGNTGLYGSLIQATRFPLLPELKGFLRDFLAAMRGKEVDWRPWIGRGPGLTPSQDDMLVGMLLAAWFQGLLLVKEKSNDFFQVTGDLYPLTTRVSVSYLQYASQGYFASPLLHFLYALCAKRCVSHAVKSLLALGHTSGADTLLGFWLVQQSVKG